MWVGGWGRSGCGCMCVGCVVHVKPLTDNYELPGSSPTSRVHYPGQYGT